MQAKRTGGNKEKTRRINGAPSPYTKMVGLNAPPTPAAGEPPPPPTPSMWLDCRSFLLHLIVYVHVCCPQMK